MKILLASWGTRGDVEPNAALGRELMSRGHDVHMAVPPAMVGLLESIGLPTSAWGPDMDDFWSEDFLRNFWRDLFRTFWTIRGPIRLVRELWEPLIRHWGEMSKTLASLADGVDLLFVSQVYQELAINVAEYHNIPMASLHYFPVRPSGQLLPMLPSPIGGSVMATYDWFCWLLNMKAENAQRRELGLPRATSPTRRRMIQRRWLELQAYDEVCFPGLTAEWAKWERQRPFVGSLTMGLTTDADDEVAAWVVSGKPPICFGFGSMTVESPVETIRMIGAACAELGERALVCSGWSNYSNVPHADHVKVVGVVNYATILPACRAFVHHGGSGTTAAGLRAGLPTLILWTAGDQPAWGAQVKRLKVGASRHVTKTTTESLITDLRRILAPDCAMRARDLAARMSKPAESIGRAADHLENFARARCTGIDEGGSAR